MLLCSCWQPCFIDSYFVSYIGVVRPDNVYFLFLWGELDGASLEDGVIRKTRRKKKEVIVAKHESDPAAAIEHWRRRARSH